MVKVLELQKEKNTMEQNKLHATTILCVRKDGEVCIASDGQVSLGPTITKSTAKKIKTYNDGKVLVGFAGSVSDCIILIDKDICH